MSSFPSISGTGDGAPMVSPFIPFLIREMEHRLQSFPSISDTGDRAPMISLFLPFLVQGIGHRLSCEKILWLDTK